MIYSLHDLPQDAQEQAGGKGATLASLHQAGYRVPNGFILLTTAFTQAGLNPSAWQQAKQLLTQFRQKNPDVTFAIRSSATSEDSAQASFAGEFESLLSQRTDEEIEAAIQTVFISRLSEQAKAYSQSQGIAESHDMAVVVQEMVPAELSGVLFTADPVNSDRMRMVGNVVQGLGDQLVSGAVTGERFTIHQPRGKYTGAEIVTNYAKALFRLGRRLERDLGSPQDIEWAMANGKIYLLQSRPITTMESFNPVTGELNDSVTGNYLWTSANAGEAFPEVMLPLSWSISKIFLNAASPPLFTAVPAFGIVAGRVYLNTANVPILGMRLGFKRKTMVGAVEGVSGKIPDDMSIPDLPLRTLPLLLDAVKHLAPFIRKTQKTRKKLPQFLAHADEEMNAWQAQVKQAGTPAELAAVWRAHQLYFIEVAPMMLAVGGLEMVGMPHNMIDQLSDMVGRADANALLAGFSPTDHHLESVGPMVGMAMLKRGEMSRDQYIKLYGHRGPNEGDMGQPRPGEDPAWLDKRIAEFSSEALVAEQRLNDQRTEHQAARVRLKEQFPRKSKRLLKKIDKFADTLHARERVRSKITRLISIWRAWALKVGRVTGLGEDVFYLTLDELLTFLDEGSSHATTFLPQRRQTYDRYRSYPRYPTLIRGRFDPALWITDPNRRYDYFDSDVSFAPPATTNSLTGIPGAMGIVEGHVRVLHSIDEATALQPGEILVAVLTDVGWTPVFPRAAAVVTDIGAALSHASIVARELGVPAVVGCGNATERLKTGDRVRVNGGQGVVEIL